jgi:hypothetical protein
MISSGAEDADAGVVHQPVQPGPAGVPGHHAGGVIDLAGIGDVEQHGRNLPARALAERRSIRGPADPGEDVVPVHREPQRGGPPDAGRGPGDQDMGMATAVHRYLLDVCAAGRPGHPCGLPCDGRY